MGEGAVEKAAAGSLIILAAPPAGEVESTIQLGGGELLYLGGEELLYLGGGDNYPACWKAKDEFLLKPYQKCYSLSRLKHLDGGVSLVGLLENLLQFTW